MQAIEGHRVLKVSLGQSVRRATGVAPDHLAKQDPLGQQDRQDQRVRAVCRVIEVHRASPGRAVCRDPLESVDNEDR